MNATAGPVVARGAAAPPGAGADPSYPGLAADPTQDDRTGLQDAAVFTAASYAAQALLFLAGLIQKALLGPLGAGYWSLMQTFWTFLTIAPLGAFHGASRQIPAHRGRGDYAAAGAAANTGSSFSIAAITVVGVTLAVVALVFGGGWANELRWGLVILGLTAPLRLLSNAHEVVLQATKRFRTVSASEIARAGVVLTAQSACVALFGFYGMFLGLMLSLVVMFVVWGRSGAIGLGRPAFKLEIQRGRVRELIAFGAPIMMSGQIWTLFLAVDSLIVASFLGVESLGYYSLALSVTAYILLLPKSVGAALFPRMAERFGKSQDIASIRHYATDVQRLLAYMLLPLATAAVFFLVPFLIRHALPEFVPAIPVVRVIAAATFLLALMNMPIKLLITAGYRWSLTAVMAACMAVNAALNVVAVAVLDLGLDGAAAATAASYAIAFLVTSSFGLGKALPGSAVVAHLGELCLIFLYTVAAMWGTEFLLGEAARGVGYDLLLALAKLSFFAVLVSPLIFLAQRRFQGVTIFSSVVKDLVPSRRRR